jgi:hypothetical protein
LDFIHRDRDWLGEQPMSDVAFLAAAYLKTPDLDYFAKATLESLLIVDILSAALQV